MSEFLNNLRQPSEDIHGQHTQQTKISKCNFINMWLFAWIPSGTQNEQINPQKKLAKKHKGCRGRSIWLIFAYNKEMN
jgi:hypothetical protein